MMQSKSFIERIRTFIENEQQDGKKLTVYQLSPDLSNFFNESKIKVGLDEYKDIILQEETELELGGSNKSSFSLLYPTKNIDSIHKGTITLLGKEVDSIREKSVDFGLIVLIGIDDKQELELNRLRQLSFISNSIEGFMIRTIPRKFWCRISSETLKNDFSFEFLGNSIIYLYQLKFGNKIKSIELILINSYPDTINNLVEISSDILTEIKQNWTSKIENWKKNIDCEYDWACEICPYRDDCQYFKDMLEERSKMDN